MINTVFRKPSTLLVILTPVVLWWDLLSMCYTVHYHISLDGLDGERSVRADSSSIM